MQTASRREKDGREGGCLIAIDFVALRIESTRGHYPAALTDPCCADADHHIQLAPFIKPRHEGHRYHHGLLDQIAANDTLTDRIEITDGETGLSKPALTS